MTSIVSSYGFSKIVVISSVHSLNLLVSRIKILVTTSFFLLLFVIHALILEEKKSEFWRSELVKEWNWRHETAIQLNAHGYWRKN